jgi:DNA-binding MarR family transcriptional regulator
MPDNNLNELLMDKIFSISRLMRHEMASSPTVSHLTMLQLQVLAYLASKTDAQMLDIADHFRISKPTATVHLDRLVLMKLVKRFSDKNDRRITKLMLTVKGQRLFKEGLKRKNEHVIKMLAYLSDKDKQAILDILNKLVAKIEKTYEK